MSFIVNPALPKLVQAPRPDFSVFGNGEGMVGAGGDVFDLTAREAEFTGFEGIETRSLDNSATELELSAVPPSEDFAFFGEGEDMVVAGGDFHNVLHTWEEDGSGLNADIGCVPENTIGALRIALLARVWNQILGELG